MSSSIRDLELLVARCRAALDDAEKQLTVARARQPQVGDFVRSPLTNFFGRVTKITQRPHGRPWVEITPYLSDELIGRGTLDLFDSWEIIDPPATKSPVPGRTPVRMR